MDTRTTALEQFQRLKAATLLEYQKNYPYFKGNWKTFTSQDIQNLIELIENRLRETVSEKWIYTHLKPAQNDKLPRKDMLDIFSRLIGFSGWDEFIFLEDEQAETPQNYQKRRHYIYWVAAITLLLVIGGFIYIRNNKTTIESIELKDEYTKKHIKKEDIKVYKVEDNRKIPLEIKNDRIEVETGNQSKIVVESPYYKKKSVELKPSPSGNSEILVEPDDHAMMLKAFMKSDIKDWQTRKIQLDRILSDELEVIVMLKDNLGAEFFNKEEFSQKLIIPTPSIKNMKITELKNGTNNKIQFIRIVQE